ncbi:FAD-dependent oxidoreductase [Glutamicibacter sp. JL.03c]|uniref:NAD(P)/FAD-dependent oxidoreductase n=1 Tax=Glutamicibacter sp. JL.03c TaxID=2984842 RepID=UPI0021F7A28C|nr:FAD-dependent oxidoreductase [Glutamicibacter sp. JL.03c]UYQ76978.1 FAD-dependent oxidoreductase [Glutamicibacter sp. JL.03c]
MPSVHIIGGGVAGYTLARELVRQHYAGTIIISEPQGLPYDRPPLSKSLQIEPFVPAAWYAEHGIELRQEKIAQLPLPAAPDDWVVLATGTTPELLEVPGAGHARTLHTAADAAALAQALDDSMFGLEVLVIGAGLIGAEFASTASMLGAQVTLVSNSEAPLAPVLGHELAAQLHADHGQRGIRTITGTVERIAADHVLVDGQRLEAEVILSAIGVRPDTALASALGLEVDDGILVDAQQRALGHRQVLAIGDAARHQGARRTVHWEAAMEDAAQAAATILGAAPVQRSVPWFWTDRHEMHVETVGDFRQAASTVLRRNRRGKLQAVFGLDAHGVLVAASMVDGGLMAKAVKRLVARGSAPSIEHLEDPSVGPRELGRSD